MKKNSKKWARTARRVFRIIFNISGAANLIGAALCVMFPDTVYADIGMRIIRSGAAGIVLAGAGAVLHKIIRTSGQGYEE